MIVSQKYVSLHVFLKTYNFMEINQLLSDGTSPRAEYDPARMILMHEPGMELYDGVIHPSAALYEHYFDVDAAAAEHRGYQDMLRKNGIKVITVKEILMNTDIAALRQMVENVLIYDASSTSFDLKEVDASRKDVINRMTRADLIRTLLFRPIVRLQETEINTGMEAITEHNPLMNLYFMRDQTISTPKGQILCKMNSSQREDEVDIVELCYKTLGVKPVYRIKGEDSFLEGGDYIPFGDMGLVGQGLRTTQAALDEMMEADVIGHDTLVVVRDHWKNQYQMHLDTYFNVIDKDLVTMCYNRYDAADESDENFLTADVYTREPGTKQYHEVPELHGQSFKEFLANRGVHIIRVQKSDADHYANNYLTIDARHIMSVAGQSRELEEEYKKFGVNVEWVPLDNLIGGYGAAHCMTQVLRRVSAL